MNDKIKTHLTTAYMMFVFEFHDPSQVSLELTFDLSKLFDTQRLVEKTRRNYGKENFKKIMSLYFNQFQQGSEMNIEALDLSLKANKKTMARHIGKDRVTFLALIVTLLKALEVSAPKRGLLFEGVS